MRVLISGASGFIGKSLTARLLERGDEVVHLVRREPESDSEAILIRWDTTDPDSVNVDDLGAVDAVFNFSGATVAKRWTRNYLDDNSSSRIIT
ncbi:MAG: NAD-dependent epimerase/dehydratase family protein, partial [Chloroflexi bacterium]|nr:NAD-dependent epimerase/dehydratase family protein [Chloroflexota bacterium]